MSGRAIALASCVCVLGLTACGPGVREDPCADVSCSSGTVCDPADGRCRAPAADGGPGDGGPDAGSVCGSCAGATPVCDEAARTCVRCTPTAGCAAGETCDRSVEGGRCVLCRSDLECLEPTPRCDVEKGRCVACVADGDCGGDAPVCDTAANRCVRCTPARGCQGARPACDTSVPGGLCVQCTSNAHCGGATPACDASIATCVECTQSSDCGGATPACDPAAHRCVGCLSSDDCGGAAPVCDRAAQKCVACTASAGCAGERPVCDLAVPGGACVGCTAHAQCSGATPLCDPAAKRCVACLGDGQCPEARPVCDETTRACVACNGARGCGGDRPVCDLAVAGGRCVECTGADDCRTDEPVCETLAAGGRCVECTTDAHCGPGATPACLAGANGGRCVECAGDSWCGGATPVCNPATAACVGCLDAGDCGGATPVCDLSSHRCVACTAAEGCSGATPVCDTSVAGGRCVGCTGASHCGGATPVCDPATKSCVQCVGDGQCAAPKAVCDPAAKACVTCLATRGCAGTTPVCDTAVAGGRCVACTGNGHCAGATPVCETTAGVCVGCLGAGDCGPAAPVCDPATRACVVCTATQGCQGATPVCDPSVAGGRCVQCTSAAHCAAPTPFCEAGARRCVECLSSASCANPEPVCGADSACRPCVAHAECSAGLACAAGSCGVLPDTCASAATVTFPAGTTTVSFTADAGAAADDYQASCNLTLGGRELVYRVVLPSPSDLTVTAARAAGSTANPVIYARSTANCALGHLADLFCKDSGSASPAATESWTLLNVSGELMLLVEAAGATPGVVDVTLRLDPPTVPPPNDECATATALSFDAQGRARASGSTRLATNSSVAGDQAPTCSSTARTASPDVVFSYTLPVRSDVAVHVTPTGAPPTLAPVVYVRKPGACASGLSADELGCTTPYTTPSDLELRAQPADTYYLWIDGFTESSGRFDLDVQATPTPPPPANDDCAAPAWLTFVGGSATDEGDTWYATNGNSSTDGSPSCSATARATGLDVVHAFHLDAPADVTVRVAPTGLVPRLRPVVYLRPLAGCASGAAATQLACAAAGAVGPATTRADNVPAGDYAVWVDSESAVAAGPYLLEVGLSAPATVPGNDACGGMESLAPDATNQAVAQGSTTLATNSNLPEDQGPTCSASARATGRDVVYGLSLAAGGNVTVVAAPAPGSSLLPVVYLRSDGLCSAGQQFWEWGCDDATRPGMPAALRVSGLGAGTWPVFVDGASDSAGAYTLQARVGPPPNETCAAARPIRKGVPVVDSTGWAANNYARTAVPGSVEAYSGCGSYSLQGQEVVFAYTATLSGTATATLRPDANFDPVLLVLTGASCSPASCTAYRDQGYNGGTETLSFPVTAGQTYWLVVEGYSATEWGGFVLTVD